VTATINSVGSDAEADVLAAELIEKLAARLRAGEAVEVEAFLQAHPGQAGRLRRLWPTIQVLAELGYVPASGSGPSFASDADRAGGTLGDFRILHEIGRGGMGIVYEAEQISLNRRVALKVLPFAATMDPRHLQRFKHEAQAAAALHHSHIVPVYYVGCERGVHFFAMQLIEGQTLAAVLQQLRRPKGPEAAAGSGSASAGPEERTGTYSPTPAGGNPGQRPAASQLATAETVAALTTQGPAHGPAYFRSVAHLGIQAAEALEHAHQLGVVHRDVKPGNLLLDGRGNLWVTDFGLARLPNDPGLTLTGDLIGTLRYMSPEQALAKRVVIDHRTDVYSLGATLYELLALRPVFGGNDRQELLRQIAFEEARPPRRWNKAIPAELETIVLKALEKNPADRYPTPQELADDLERFVKDEPIRARRPSLSRRLRGWCRRHKAVVASAALVMFMAVLLGGVNLLWWAQQRTETQRAVGQDLEKAEFFQDQERWLEAARTLERAAGRLAGGGPDELRQRVEQRQKEVALVDQLEEARLRRLAIGKGARDYAASDRAYAAAFATQGLDLKAMNPEKVAGRIRSLAIRRQLVPALDDWAFVKDKLLL
jgi:serine/threonine protein kinase